MNAQVNFTFTYNGPDSIGVGADCNAILDWGDPETVSVSCNSPDCEIITFELFSISDGYNEGDPVPVGESVVITYFAEDDDNNTAFFGFRVLIVDKEPPVFDNNNVPQDITYNCISDLPPPPPNSEVIANDNCPAPGGTPDEVTITYNGETNDGIALCNGGTITRSWTATDASGNTAVYTQTIMINTDTEPPVITGFPSSASEPCGAADYEAWIASQRAAFQATDNGCGIRSLTDDAPDSFENMCGPLTFTFTATDECGLSSTTTASYAVIDVINPVWTDNPEDLMVNCNDPAGPNNVIQAWLDNGGNGTVTDDCSDVTFTDDFAQMPEACGPGVTITFTATDACGNTSSQSATLTVFDNTPPTWDTDPQPLNLVCDQNTDIDALIQNWLDNNGNGAASDECSQGLTYRNNYVGLMNACGNAGSTTVNFRVRDDCGNTVTRSASLTVVDNTPPQLDASAQSVEATCDDPNAISYDDWIASHGGAMATDACTPLTDNDWTATIINSRPGCGASFSRTVAFVVTDACGNENTTTATYSLTDETPPSVDPMAANMNETCGGGDDQSNLNAWIDNIGGATATDNCGDPVWLDFNYTTSTGMSGNNIFLGNTPAYPQVVSNTCNFSVTVTWRVIDECDNSTTTFATFTVLDDEGPMLNNVPISTTVSCENVPPANDPTVTDNCDNNPSLDFIESNEAGDCPGEYTLTRMWTATDDCGNTTTAMQVVTVQDNTAPVFNSQPGNQVVSCDAVPPAAAIMATDNCDLDPTVDFTETRTNGTCPNNYVLTRSWIATDNCGNQSMFNQTITVMDTEAPQFVGPSNLVVSCEQGTDPAVTGAPAAVTDNCDPDPTFSNTDIITPGSCPNEFTITRTWTARDICGNISPPFVQTISVIDNQGPAIDPVAINTNIDCTNDANAETAFQNWVSNNGGATATDNCSAAADLTWNAWVPGSYNLNDPSTLPGDDVENLDAADCSPGTNGAYRSESVDFVVFDECGNASVTNATFSVSDDEAPVMEDCPTELMFTAAAGTCEAEVTLPAPTITDNCNENEIRFSYSINGGIQITVDPVGPITRTMPVGNYVITYLASDCAGNESTCLFFLGVNDLEPPTIECPDDISRSLDPMEGCENGVQITLPLPTVVDDNCSYPVVTQVQPAVPSERFITYAFDSDYQEYIAEDKVITFTGLAANAVGNTVSVSVKIEGEADNAEAYYSVFGEDGALLGTTEVGQPHVSVLVAGNCNANPVILPLVAAQFDLPAAQYNSYAGDGNLTLTLVANRTFIAPAPGIAGEGINPACTTFANGTPDGQNDGASQITVQLDVEKATPYYFTTGATVTPPTTMQQPAVAPTINFETGVTEVFYVINDISGNTDSCSFTVTIQDNVPPVADCEPTTIFINPDGLNDYELQPFEVDNQSFDNCEIVEYTVFPNTFNCQQAGQSFEVTLTVRDAQGNTDSCTAMVRVEIDNSRPSFSVGLCGNDTLSLFANPPFPTGAANYTYSWTGPNGFTSTEADPAIPGATSANSGTYTVVVTGTTGCTSTGDVEVIVNDAPDTPNISASQTQICENESLILSTQATPGNNVVYNWYRGTPPAGMLITSTTTEQLTIQPTQSTEFYYVIIEVDDCISAPSATVNVEALPVPEAVVNEEMIQICEGGFVSLGSTSTGNDYSYQWTGPNGYVSNQQNPMGFIAGENMAGAYTLIITANGCSSDPAVTMVVVDPTPDDPILSVDNATVCAGDNATLTTNITDGTSYIWTRPDGTTVTTADNTLIINNLTSDESGAYSVIVNYNDCPSETSDPISIFVERRPDAIAENSGPSCDTEDIQLVAVSSTENATYSWSGPNMFTSSEQNPLVEPVAGTYTLVVTSPTGCSNTFTTEVIVSETPAITEIDNNSNACANGMEDILLTATVSPANGDYEFEWTGPGFTSRDSVAVIPDGTAANNGTYTLIITNSDGCVSDPMSMVIDVQDAPAMPAVFGSTTVCEGDPLTLTTDAVTGAMVTYDWQTPNGIVTTPVPSLTIFPAEDINSGDYTLTVTVDGCASAPSITTQVSVIEMPAQPAILTVSDVCAGTSLQLTTEEIPGATYEWTGPDGFDPPNVHNPVIFNVSENNEGAYTVRIILGDCASETSEPVSVTVNESPEPPVVFSEGAACISEENAEVVFSIVPSSATAGGTYTWFNAENNELVFGPTTSLNFTMRDFSGFTDGAYEFYAVTTASGCPSLNSVPVAITFNTIPEEAAVAGEDISVCGSQDITLSATQPQIGMGNWTQIAGPALTITDPANPNTAVNGLTDGASYALAWTLSNGACGNYDSDEIVITVDVNGATAEAGENLQACDADDVMLTATAAMNGNQGTWTQSAEQASQGVRFDNVNNPNTVITGMENGQTYTFTWTLSNDGCGDFSSDEVTIEILPDAGTAFAGEDNQDCGDGTITLSATPVSGNNGTWTTDDPTVLIESPNDATTEVSNLIPGDYTFTWTVDAGICGMSADEVTITYNDAPIAEQDAAVTGFGDPVDIDVVENDEIPSTVVLTIESDPRNGRAIVLANGSVQYIPDPTFAGTDEFIYMICSEDCPEECSETSVTITVGADAPCEVPTIITPNNDGTNDSFIIPCLATGEFPDNLVTIFNQWGDEVYRSENYQNDWEGDYNGNALPVGTYYFVVDFKNGEKPTAGFVIIERQKNLKYLTIDQY